MNTTGKKFGGRKKGTPNLATQETREIIKNVLDDNHSTFIDKLNQIENPTDYCNVYLKLLSFVQPKPIQTPISTGLESDETPRIDEIIITKISV